MLATKTPPAEALQVTPPTPAITPLVHVVDDEPAILGLFRSMGRNAGFEVAGYGSAKEFFERFDEGHLGCLVLDLNLPDGTGIEILQEMSVRGHQIPVVFMSGMARVSEAVSALKLGSVDFIEKPFDLHQMITTLQKAIEKDRQRRSSSATTDEIRRRFARLTAREAEVMELVVAGAANKEVAAQLGLSPKTVEVHRANVMRKTQASSLAELVRLHVARTGA
jgi:two-component system response regulator FixJ